MFLIDDETKTIAVNRGDELVVTLVAKNEDGTDYTFTGSDKIRFNIFKKKDYISGALFTKEFSVAEGSTYVQIELSKAETRELDNLNKAVTYYYDIVMNDCITLIGHDSVLAEELSGAKKFLLLPRGEELDA